MHLRLSAFVFTLVAALVSTSAAGPSIETRSFDKNGDGKPDKWADFPKGQEFPTEIRYDRNFDGKVDEWEILADGRMLELREDRNFDGSPDRIVSYKGGKPWFKKVDDNYDGHFDKLVFYDGTENIRTASPEFMRLLAEKSGNAPRATTVVTSKRERQTSLRSTTQRRTPPPVAPPVYTDFFELDDPEIRLPKIASASSEEAWRLERDRSAFRALVPGSDFELVHEPTGGTLWLERTPRADVPLSESEILLERMEALSGAVRRKGLAAQRGEEKMRTPYGRVLKRVYHLSESGKSQQVMLYVLVGEGDIVYVRTSCPVNGCGEFSRLSDAMVFGLSVAAVDLTP